MKTLAIETFKSTYNNGMTEDGHNLYLCGCQGDIDCTVYSFRNGFPRVAENGEVQKAIKLEFFTIGEQPIKTILAESGRE